MEKISVLIPVYNSEQHIERCIKSIENQTYSDIEIVIVNDGSTDKTQDIIQKIAQKDDRIKLINIENQGVANARNVALSNATGEYITFVDSDDYIEDDYVQTLYDNLKKYDADIAVCNCINYIQETKEQIHKDFGIKQVKEYNSKEAVQSLFYYNFLRHSPWGKLYKKNLWNNLTFPVGRNYEDLAIIYKTFLSAKKIIYIPEEKYIYVTRKESIVHGKVKESDIQAIIMYCKGILEDITKNYIELIPAAEYLLASHELHLWYKIPNKKEYKNYINIVVKDVKKYRKSIIKNPKVSKKKKLLFILSYLGRNIYKIILTLSKK